MMALRMNGGTVEELDSKYKSQNTDWSLTDCEEGLRVALMIDGKLYQCDWPRELCHRLLSDSGNAGQG